MYIFESIVDTVRLSRIVVAEALITRMSTIEDMDITIGSFP